MRQQYRHNKKTAIRENRGSMRKIIVSTNGRTITPRGAVRKFESTKDDEMEVSVKNFCAT